MQRMIVLVLALISSVSFASDQSDQRELSSRFEPLDLFDLEWVTNPTIHPDGEKVVYVRRGYNIDNDRGRSALWIVNADGTGHEPLTDYSINAGSPVWSPDGKRLAYVATTEGSSQIHVRFLQSGRDIAITHLQESPRSLAWSPDGDRIAFIQFVPASNEPIGKLPTKPKGAKWADEARVFEDSYYRSDSSGFLKAGKSHIFIVRAEGGKAIQLTTKEFPHRGPLSFSKDGSKLYFSTNYADDWQLDRSESEIYELDVASRLTRQITTRDGGDFSPQVSPDGKWLAYRGVDDTLEYQDAKLYLTPLSQHEPKQLMDIDRGVGSIRWSSDSKEIYFSYVDESVTKVGKTDLRGRYETVAEGLGGSAIGRPYASGSFSVSRKGLVAHDVTSFEQPANLAITTKGKTQTLTNLNKELVAYKRMATVEEIWFEPAVDLKGNQKKVQGWIVKPPDFDPTKKYPLILEIHGGPTTAYGNYFTAEIQLYASAGYVVLFTNPRGSTSYGASFTREIDQDYPGADYDDLMSGVDAVVAKGYIDEENLFVTGGSGGGILTAWIVTRTDRFKAAVSQKPVINWFTHTLVADIGPVFWQNFFESPPWADPAGYLAKSPIAYVDKVKTPTMLLTGEEDFRTPMSESEQFYQGLKMNDVDAALVRIKGASHSIAARPSNLLRKVAYVIGWFERYRVKEKVED